MLGNHRLGLITVQSLSDAAQPNGQWRNDNEKKRGSQIIAQLRDVLDRDHADRNGRRRRNIAQRERQAEKDAAREAECGEPHQGCQGPLRQITPGIAHARECTHVIPSVSEESGRQAGVPPAGARVQLSWREFIRAHAASIIACDFFTVETLWLGRLYVLFFLELGTRRVHLAGCTPNPDGAWTVQQARQLAWSLPERARPMRFLIRDRDSKFSRAFDEVFRTEGVEIIRTPYRAPNANAFAERWVGTVRRDCLDWLLITSRRQLERVLCVYVEHYNTHRPHRALDLKPPVPVPGLHLVDPRPIDQLQRRQRLGGLINEYRAA